MLGREKIVDEAMLLHSLFCTFCSPPPTIMSVSSILELERHGHYKNEPNENVPLPQDSLISVSGAQKASVVSLLTHQPKTHLLKLPTAFHAYCLSAGIFPNIDSTVNE